MIETLHDGVSIHTAPTASGPTYLIVNCGTTPQPFFNGEQTHSDGCFLLERAPGAWVLFYKQGCAVLTQADDGKNYARKETPPPMRHALFSSFEAGLKAACAVLSVRALR